MFKQLRTFWNNSWLPAIVRNFIGTFLGILITFGTSAYLDKQKREDTARRLMARTVDCIDDYADQMDFNCSNLLQTDSIFIRVNECYPAHLNALGKDTLSMFISGFYNISVSQPDRAIEGIFSNNIDVMRYLDLELQVDMASCFSAYGYFMTCLDNLIREQNDIYQRCMSQKYIGDCSGVYEQSVVLLKCPEVRNYLIKYHRALQVLIVLKDALKEECVSLRQTTDLKKKESVII